MKKTGLLDSKKLIRFELYLKNKERKEKWDEFWKIARDNDVMKKFSMVVICHNEGVFMGKKENEFSALEIKCPKRLESYFHDMFESMDIPIIF